MSTSSHETQSTTGLNIVQFFKGFWRLPSITVARFTLKSYIRSGWILGDIVVVWLLYAAFFFQFGGNVAYFYATAGQGLGVLAILGTVVMTQRAMSARVYLPLARLTSRSSYVRGLILAAGALRVPLFLMLMLLALGYHQFSPPKCFIGNCIEGATVANMTIGAIGLLVNCIIISTLTVVLSVPVATRRGQIVFLAWLVAVLYSNSNLAPAAGFLAVSRIPLAPLAACYNLGATGTTSWYGLLMLALAVGYVVGLALLAEFWLARRDLLLQ